jgi:hypothetical protein
VEELLKTGGEYEIICTKDTATLWVNWFCSMAGRCKLYSWILASRFGLCPARVKMWVYSLGARMSMVQFPF